MEALWTATGGYGDPYGDDGHVDGYGSSVSMDGGGKDGDLVATPIYLNLFVLAFELATIHISRTLCISEFNAIFFFLLMLTPKKLTGKHSTRVVTLGASTLPYILMPSRD